METISTKTRNTKDFRGYFSYFWKRVASRSGENAGRVIDILLSTEDVAGLVVLWKSRTFFLDMEFVENTSGRLIMLNIDPVYLHLGKNVFDKSGRRLGKVVHLMRNGSENEFQAVEIKKSFFAKPIAVRADQIEISRKNIILKIDMD